MVNNAILLYFLGFLMGLMLFFVPQRNYLVSWLKVKLPFFKGDVQVRVKNPVNDYFAVATYSKGLLTYTAKKTKDNPKPVRHLTIEMKEYNRAVYHSNNVPCIDVDDVKNCILIWNGESYESVEGFNVEQVDKIMETIASEPDPNASGIDNKTFQYMVLGGIIILGIADYMIIKGLNTNDAHIKMVYDLVQPMFTNMNLTVTPPTIGG